MQNVIIEVSKTEKVAGKNQRTKVGEVAITVPVLDDMLPVLAGAKITGQEDGLPVYDDDRANYIQSAVLAYVKAGARNKLIPGTATLKDGLSIPTDWEGLTAEGERGGNGAALKLYAEAKAHFADYVATLGKNEKTSNLLISLFGNKTALALQPAATKAKVKAYIEGFADYLDPEALERMQRPIESVLETCDSGSDELDGLE